MINNVSTVLLCTSCCLAKIMWQSDENVVGNTKLPLLGIVYFSLLAVLSVTHAQSIPCSFVLCLDCCTVYFTLVPANWLTSRNMSE